MDKGSLTLFIGAVSIFALRKEWSWNGYAAWQEGRRVGEGEAVLRIFAYDTRFILLEPRKRKRIASTSAFSFFFPLFFLVYQGKEIATSEVMKGSFLLSRSRRILRDVLSNCHIRLQINP